MGNLLWQCVNSMEYVIFDGVEIRGGWVLLRAPRTHRMSSLRWIMHVHGVREHMHCIYC